MKKLLISLFIIISLLLVACSNSTSSFENNTGIKFVKSDTCSTEELPVCGINGETYPNRCLAGDTQILHEGPCFCLGMSFEEALNIAGEAQCAGKLVPSGFCNEKTETWWIETNIEKEGCLPACVLKIKDKTAEINWRCTGLIKTEVQRHICTTKEKEIVECNNSYMPVCGSDNQTYTNACNACISDADSYISGGC